ncbi:MFS general substrate transporter [Xylariaceae sp. FL0594]|nr:MFS general substrate transporter [Xylariaceae sp. FL0594]
MDNKAVQSSQTPPSLSEQESIEQTTLRDVSDRDVEKAGAEEILKGQPPSGPPAFNPNDFPDGGLEAWLVVAGSALILFTSFGLINCAGVFVQYYANGPLSDYSTSSITWIVSLQTFLLNASSLVMGNLFDSYGTRWILPIGTVIYALGLMLLSLSTEFYQIILTQGLVCGVGAAAVFNCATNSTLTWFFRRRAAALGIVVAGSAVGGVVLPIFMAKLIPRIGFPWTIRSLGFIVLVFCGAACSTVKSRLPPRKKPIVVAALVKPFRDIRYSLVVAASFFVFWGLYLPFNFINLQAQQQGVSPDLVPYILPILNAVGIFGRIIPGMVADRAGRFNVTILVTALSAVFTLALWIPGKSTATTFIFGALYGFASGGYISLIPPVIAQISDIREIGARSGALLFVASLASLTGSPIGGAIVSAQGGDYLGLKLWTGLNLLTGALILFVARTVQVGFKPVKI